MYIEAPATYQGDLTKLFLAGGITGCVNWQYEVAARLAVRDDLVVFNPRRLHFPMNDLGAAREQISWEHWHLRLADAILLWFPRETLCPIVLYELGAWSMTEKPLFVGVHPNYARRVDVEIQTRLARPDVKVVYSLAALVKKVEDWLT